MKKIIYGAVIGLFLSTVMTLAVSLCNAKDIEYNVADKAWDVDTLEDALNDLYKMGTDSCKRVAKPNLGSDNKLIPVAIDDNGNITKISADDASWYDYCNKKWANAVILNDGVNVPDDNSTISMSNIEAMFVWIPKYKYKLWNVGAENPLYTTHSIKIEFDTVNTKDKEGESCATPMTSGSIGNCNNGEYMTHPAFISFGVNGLWVGKFETGYKNATEKTGAEQENNNSSNIIIKPSVYSWRANTVKNFFDAAKGYESTLNSHMMKNTEWGAVAYLSHSKYGIDKEVAINNNDQYKTGYAALPSTNQSNASGDVGSGKTDNAEWATTDGVRASTTGNTTGVYDMSGGSWEYMAAYFPDSESDESTFTPEELSGLEAKYIDVYAKESTIDSYDKMILGDATGEMGLFNYFEDSDTTSRWHNSWYNDNAEFVDNTKPWFFRGGRVSSGVLAGQFSFSRYSGGKHASDSFRLVLAP